MKKEIEQGPFKRTKYYVSGEGFPVMLVHGFGEDHRIWQHVSSALEKHYRIIIPDLPGTGSSPLPKEEVSMELLAASLIAILDAEDIAQCILVGHSMGGYVSLALTEHFPERLSGLSLVHSSTYADDEEKKLARGKAIRLIQNEGKEPFLNAMIPNLYAESFATQQPETLKWHLTMAMELSSQSLEAYYQAMINRPARTSIISNTKIPVQFVIGTEDKAINPQSVLQQSYLPEKSDVHVLEGIGHSSMMESPERLNAILNSFCKYVLKN